jgi:hypothetical protein
MIHQVALLFLQIDSILVKFRRAFGEATSSLGGLVRRRRKGGLCGQYLRQLADQGVFPPLALFLSMPSVRTPF